MLFYKRIRYIKFFIENESLIDRDSLYKHLFDVQSMYYKEMDENKKRAIVFGDSFDDTMPQKLDGVF